MGFGVCCRRIEEGRKMRKYLLSPAYSPPVQRERWVCFHCRKMFRPRYAHDAAAAVRRQQEAAGNTARMLCPDCRQPLHRIGRYFKPPRRRDVKQWEKVRLLVEGGVDFYGYAPHPPKRLSEVAAYLAENHRTSKGERLLQKITRDSARQQKW